ncbi:hypothetical protein Rs2_11249 [Raphanus sativus]|nr:hypothetical protein Rs2_11249 [Raphanus sativus]
MLPLLPIVPIRHRRDREHDERRIPIRFGTVLSTCPPSPIGPSIPVSSSSPFVQSNLPPLPPSYSSTSQKVTPVTAPPSLPPPGNIVISKVPRRSGGADSGLRRTR